MASHAELIERLFERRGGELVVGGVGVAELAERFGTPLFVYDRGVLERKLATLRGALPDGFEVYYSIKANPAAALLRWFVSQGCGLEVASAGEFVQAAGAGCDPARILFAGPGKTDAELEQVLAGGIGEIHVESLDEIRRLGAIAARLGRTAGVAIRVNPGAAAQGGAMRMGGKPAPFGVDEERLEQALDAVQADGRLEFHGIHLFTGTQILDHAVLARQYRAGLEIALRASRHAGGPLRTVDFGGGLGIPYFPHEHELDTDALGRELAALFGEYADRAELRGTRFIVEPGRYLVGDSGVYLCRVTTVKESRGKRYYIVDGGMHQHLAASGNLGQVIKRNYPLAVATRLDAAGAGKVDVVGPLCTPLDVLARDVELPAAESGDLVAVLQSGAYGRTSSPLGFLSHAAPAEVLARDGRPELIRRRGTPEDLLRDQPGSGATE